MVTALSTCRMGDCRSGPGKTHLIFHPLKDYPHNQPFWSCCPSISETQTLHMNELTGIEAEGWCQWRSVLLEVNIWGLVSVIPRMCKFTFPSPCSEPLTILQWVCFFSFFHFKKARKSQVLPTSEHIHLWNFPQKFPKRNTGSMGEWGWEMRKRTTEEWRTKVQRKARIGLQENKENRW